MSNANQNQAQSLSVDDNEDLRRQFVTFYVGAECMAFDMDRVMEIVRIPRTVDVPMTPASLLGLANLRGAILPVLSLRRILGLADTDNTDASRVMVINYAGQPMGFVVDRVTRVIGVAPDSIEDMKSVRSTVNARMLSGVLKNIEGHGLIQLVDVDALTEQEYGQLKAANQAMLSAAKHAAIAQTVQKDGVATDDDQNIMQLVSFTVDGQEYSFSIEATQEIIRLPSKVNAVPKAPAHVIGMIDLRSRVLPLVKLRTLFGLPECELSEMNRIVVLTLRHGSQHSMVGVVVDEVREVLRIRKEQVEAVPAMLLGAQDSQELEGICQLDNGQRIVTLLSAEKLFKRSDIIEAVDAVEQSHHAAKVPGQTQVAEAELKMNDETGHELEDEEPQLVVFNLESQEYGVMIESVREILRLPENLTKVPKTGDFVEGMINLRGNVLPIIDMRSRFELKRQVANDRQRILVLNHNNSLTGYVVDSVSEVLRLQANQIEAAPNLSEQQARVMGRIVNLRDKKRIITVLEPDQLLSSAEQAKLAAHKDESVSR